MKYLLTVVLLFSFSQAAALGFISSGDLLEYCEARLSETGSAAEGNSCYSFVAGISDAHDNFTVLGKMSPLWCLPDNVDTSQLIRVVTKYLQEHPESLHFAASSMVLSALELAFPCE